MHAGSRWLSQPIRSLRYIVTCTRIWGTAWGHKRQHLSNCSEQNLSNPRNTTGWQITVTHWHLPDVCLTFAWNGDRTGLEAGLLEDTNDNPSSRSEQYLSNHQTPLTDRQQCLSYACHGDIIGVKARVAWTSIVKYERSRISRNTRATNNKHVDKHVA